MLMFSRNGSATKDVSGSNSAHATPKHHYHRLSTSSAAAMMSPRGVFLTANSPTNSPKNGYINRLNGRKSYCDPGGTGGYAISSVSSKGQPLTNVVGAVKGQQQNGTNCPPPNEDRPSTSVFKRSTSRSTMKKNRPHSWHSTLQRGFNRARSRSTGRGEREQRKEEKEQQANSSNSKSKGRK